MNMKRIVIKKAQKTARTKGKKDYTVKRGERNFKRVCSFTNQRLYEDACL